MACLLNNLTGLLRNWAHPNTGFLSLALRRLLVLPGERPTMELKKCQKKAPKRSRKVELLLKTKRVRWLES